MAKAQRAQVGEGDPNVVAHPAYRKLPGPQFPLHTAEATEIYEKLARAVFDAGQFSLSKHLALSRYALMVDTYHTAVEAKRPVRASWFDQMKKAERELQLDGLDKPIAAPSSAPVNPYARFGRQGGR